MGISGSGEGGCGGKTKDVWKIQMKTHYFINIVELELLYLR